MEAQRACGSSTVSLGTEHEVSRLVRCRWRKWAGPAFLYSTCLKLAVPGGAGDESRVHPGAGKRGWGVSQYSLTRAWLWECLEIFGLSQLEGALLYAYAGQCSGSYEASHKAQGRKELCSQSLIQ